MRSNKKANKRIARRKVARGQKKSDSFYDGRGAPRRGWGAGKAK